MSKKSVFNKITGDNQLERDFATFLENCPDVLSYTKNYFAVNFKLDYVNADGDISNYYPDFTVKLADGSIVIAETKGREDTDVAPKMRRLAQWCVMSTKFTTKFLMTSSTLTRTTFGRTIRIHFINCLKVLTNTKPSIDPASVEVLLS